MRETRKRIGEVSFGYKIRVNGDVVKEGKAEELLWLRQWMDPDYMQKPRQELFFAIKDYPKDYSIIGEWVVRKLGPFWHRRYECHWNFSYVRIAGGGDVVERFRELVRMGWVKEPEKARIKLISSLLLEADVEKGGRSQVRVRNRLRRGNDTDGCLQDPLGGFRTKKRTVPLLLPSLARG
jgi:hypothetical protein